MTSRKYRSVQNITLLFVVTIFVAQKCILQLLPIYLKYLNFSATEAGIIRASQTWISMFLIPVFTLIPKCLQSAVWKRLATSVLLLISIALYLCLTLIPMSNMLQDVTHCQNFIPEELVKMYRSTQWDHHKSIQISSNTANTSTAIPPIKMSYANNIIVGNASSATWSSTSTVIPVTFKQGSLPISLTEKKTQLKGSSNFSSDNNSEMLRLFNVASSNNATEENVTGERQSFPSETEQKLSQLMTNDAKTVATLKPNLIPVVDEKVEIGDKKNIDPLIPKRIKFMHNQANYYSNQKMQYHPNSVGNSFHNKFDVVDEMGTEKLQNANKLELGNKNEHVGNSMKTMISLLNKTVSKINFVRNKFLLSKKGIFHKSDNNNWSADSMHIFNSLPHSEGNVRLPGQFYNPVLVSDPDSEASDVAEQNSKELPERKEKIVTYASSNNGLQSNEAWLQHSNKNSHNELERIDDSLISDRNIVNVTRLGQQISQKEHKHVRKYYPQQNVNISDGPGITPEKIYLNSGEETEKGNKSTNQGEGQIRNILSRPHNEEVPHNHLFEMFKQEEERRQNTKIDETSGENSNYVTAKLMMEKTNKRLQENVSGSDKPPREPHHFRSVSSKSQLREHILHEPYINHLSHNMKNNINQFYKRNSVHTRLKKTTKSLIHDKNEKFIKTRQRTTRRLLYVDLTETKKSVDNSSEFQVDEVRKFWSDHQLWNFISRSKLVTSWNTSFSTILIIAVFAEMFSKGAFVTSIQFIQSSNVAEISVQEHVNERNDYRYKVPTLLCWGLFGCPLLTILVLATECSYQARVFLLFSTGFYLMSLLVSLFLLPLPETNSKWKLDNYIHKEKHETTSFLKRFGHSISTIVNGFAMACNAEFILWHIETLHGFTHNYQILYNSYIGLGVLTEALAITWLKQRRHKLMHVQDSTVSEPTDVYNAALDGLSSVGPVLLGLHFLAASLLLPAWALVFLGILQGCCTALLPNMISAWWKLGYGFGCLIGGVMVEAHGADWMFWIMAGTMFVWSAMVTLFGGLLKCIGNNNRDQAAYSQLLLPEDESDSEDVEICENEDWLEKAIQKDEQQEAQRRRIKSCPT